MSSLAAWLHDGPVQNLIVADQELAAGDVERARTILRATIADLRGALADGPREPVPAGDDVLLSVARELLTNVTRHAEAHRVVLEVTDDGRGFAGAPAAGHLGLALVAERVRSAGGQLRIDSAPGAGTRVRVVIPTGRAASPPRRPPRGRRRPASRTGARGAS
ncbi:hypothetical protein C8N24_1126 [Solirubrobacter pauli]|uniref:histidine kinase n=1 Tax=Solirubrobacter pauli TaxID=166793 RepID=A0A660LEG7_9ACTN|nr:ATP-binding protein [Solirubrobacter pauli]RKQ91304.1 hypothetical protein C8N24_1126 [Solirubrobacter pauli]